MSEELETAKIIRVRDARRPLDTSILRHLPALGPIAHSAVIITDENGNHWQLGRTKGREQLEYRMVDIQVLKDRQKSDGYWYQEVKINNREHWEIEYEGTIPSRDMIVKEGKEFVSEVIKESSYHLMKANCYSAGQKLLKHLNPEKPLKYISPREPDVLIFPGDHEEFARLRRLSSPKPEGGIQNDIPQQPNADKKDLCEQKDGSREHSLPRAYDDLFIDMLSRSTAPCIRGACAQGIFYKCSSFEALNLEHSTDSVLDREASGKLKIPGLPRSMSSPPSDHFANVEDALMDGLREPSYVPSSQTPPIDIIKMDLPNGELPEVQFRFNEEFSRLNQRPNIQLKHDSPIKVSDEHQKIIRDGIAQATHAKGAKGCINGIAIGSVGAVVSSVTGGALTVAPTAAGGVALSLNLLNPWAWVAIG